MFSESWILTFIYVLGVLSAIIMGLLMRLIVNPQEAVTIKNKIRELERTLPPKHMRTPKHERKARIIESEIRKLRRKYTIISMKRLTIMFLVYGLSLAIIFLKLPPLISSPISIPFFTYEIDGKSYIPISMVYIMVILLLSPISLRIAEPPIAQSPPHTTKQETNAQTG